MASALFKEKQADILFLYISTYTLSSVVLQVVNQIKVPLLLLNIQPAPAIDYNQINSIGDRGKMTGEWLANCQACSVPEIASVFNRSGVEYEIITGHMQEDYVWKELSEWVSASLVLKGMRSNTMGVLGHYYGGMLDVYTDITKQSAIWGTHFELIEMCDLKQIRDEVTRSEVDIKIKEFHAVFDVAHDCEVVELERAARTSVALDKLAEKWQFGSLAYYYEGTGNNDYLDMVTSVIAGNTLLTSKHIPVAGECEVKNAQAMKIMDLIGAGGSFSEFYAMDFTDNVVLLGHDGPAHPVIAEGLVKLVPLPVYHGKPGKGLSIQMSVRQGPVTLLSVAEGPGGVFLLVAQGKSVPGPILEIGNTNSRYKFPLPARDFINAWSKAGPAHHCAIGTGHVAPVIEKLAFLAGIPIVKIC